MRGNGSRRDVGLAVVLVLAVLIAGANFVLVEVRLLIVQFETRLSWVLLVPAILGFATGVSYTRKRSGSRPGP